MSAPKWGLAFPPDDPQWAGLWEDNIAGTLRRWAFVLTFLEDATFDVITDLRELPDPTDPAYDAYLVPSLLNSGTRLEAVLHQLHEALMDFRGTRRRIALSRIPEQSEERS